MTTHDELERLREYREQAIVLLNRQAGELDRLRVQRDAALALLHPIESFCGWHDIEEIRQALGETEDELAEQIELERRVSSRALGVSE